MTGATRHGRLELRPIGPDDEAFVRALYTSTRATELAAAGWPEEAIRAFCDSQFDLQDRDYRARYPEEVFRLVTEDGRPVGRWYVHRGAEFRVVEVTIAPEDRGRGIARTLMGELMDEAARLGRPITLHVEPTGVAFDWYRRLGFTVVEDGQIYAFMRWDPPESSS